MKTLLRRYVPWKWKRAIMLTGYRALDVVDTVTGETHPMVPPRAVKVDVGQGDYLKIGAHLKDCMVAEAGLLPTSRVLEIGSGYGRVAVALTDFLTSGTYDGIDIIKAGVDWSNQRIGARFPNFRFHHADLANTYVDGGTGKAEEYRLPFDDGSFDFIFLTSVFTHMRPKEIAHYLKEMARVLAPGGRTFSTFYLANDATKPRMRDSTGVLFQYRLEDFYVASLETPDAAVCVEESDALAWHAAAGLSVDAVKHGGWAHGKGSLTWQDAIIATKA